jgi:acetyl-CoA carboxylase carboxyl transferase subunit alpha
MTGLFEFERQVDRLRKKIEELKSMGKLEPAVIEEIERKFQKKIREFYENLSAWDRVQIARHPDRPHSID